MNPSPTPSPPFAPDSAAASPARWRGLAGGLRRAGTVVLGGLVLSAALGAGGWVWLQSDAGRDWLVARFVRTLVPPGMTVWLREPGGKPPFTLTFAALELADRDGPWLRTQRVLVRLEPWSLLAGAPVLAQVEAGTVQLLRAPQAAPLPDFDAAAPIAAGGGIIPALPAIRHLGVDELILPAGTAGETAVFRGQGEAQMTGGAWRVTAALARSDGPEGTARLQLVLPGGEIRPDGLAVELDVTEPAGGLVARALDLPGLPPLQLQMKGTSEGSDSWRGRLTAAVAGVPVLEAEAGLRLQGDARHLALTAGGPVQRVLPSDWAAALGPAPRLTVAAVLDRGGGVVLSRGELTAAAATLAMHGRVEAKGVLDLQWTATPGAAFSALALVSPGSRWRRLAASGTITGTRMQPLLEAEIQAEGLALGETALHAGRGRVKVRLPGLTLGPALVADVSADFTLDRLSGSDPALSKLAGPRLSGVAAGLWRPFTGELRQGRLVLGLAAGRLTLEGLRREGDGRLETGYRFPVDDLARLAGPLGLALSGVAELEGRARWTPGSGRANPALALDLGGTLRGLQGDDPRLNPLLGALSTDPVRLGGILTLAGRSMTLADLRLTSRLGQFHASGDIGGNQGKGKVRLEVPRLAPFGEVMHVPVAGGLVAEATYRGDFPVSRLTVTATLANLEVKGRKLGTVRAEVIRSTDGPRLAPQPQPPPPPPPPPPPQFTLRLLGDGESRGLGLTANASFARGATSQDEWQIAPLALTLGGNRAQGTLTVAGDGSTAAGRLSAQLPDLATLSPWLGHVLAGSAQGEVILERRGKAQTLQATGIATALRWGEEGGKGGGLTAQRLETKARFTAASLDALMAGEGRGSLSLAGSRLHRHGLTLDRASAILDGTPNDTALRLSLGGHAAETLPVVLEAEGRLSTPGLERQWRVDKASLRLGNDALTLARPATLTLGAGRATLHNLDLGGRGTRLTADLDLDQDTARGRLEARRLPLPLLMLTGGTPAWGGTADAEIQLSGTPAAPQAAVRLRLDGVRPLAAPSGLEAWSGSAEGQWRDEKLSLAGTLAPAGGGAGLRVEGEVPLRAGSGRTGSAPEGIIRGVASGTVDLGRLNDLLAAGGDRLSGQARVDLTAAGTMAAPRLSGTVTVADGRYENLALGLVVRDLRLRLTGQGTELVLEEFRGAAGREGTLTASGRLTPLAPPGRDVFALRLMASKARLVETEPLVADADADLSLEGRPGALRLGGRIAVRRAELRLPRSLPRAVVDLPVEERAPLLPPSPPRRKPAPGTPVKPQPASPASPASPSPASPSPASRPGTGEAPGVAFWTASSDLPVLPELLDPATLSLALAVTAPGQIFLRGRGLEAEFAADLAVSGLASAPRVKGRMPMIQGQVNLLSRPLPFRRGMVLFPGTGPALDPDLDLLAEGRAGNANASLRLHGSFRAPRLTLASTPPQPPDEVLARLLFDKPVAQLTPAEVAQLANAAVLLSGLGTGASGLLDRLRRGLGVDRLGFTGGRPGSDQGALAVGRYVEPNLYLGLEQGLTATSTRARVEVDLGDNLQAEASLSPAAVPSVGMKWEWEY